MFHSHNFIALSTVEIHRTVRRIVDGKEEDVVVRGSVTSEATCVKCNRIMSIKSNLAENTIWTLVEHKIEQKTGTGTGSVS